MCPGSMGRTSPAHRADRTREKPGRGQRALAVVDVAIPGSERVLDSADIASPARATVDLALKDVDSSAVPSSLRITRIDGHAHPS